jgi:FtsP/CotA-like multicopper oxidase with cupredoxin domain
LIVEDSPNVGTDDEGVKKFLANERLMTVSNLEGQSGRWVSELDKFVIHPGEWYRFRILSVSVDSHSSSHNVVFGEPDACETAPIAHDGILRFEVPGDIREDNTYGMTTSSRLDLAVRCSKDTTVSVGGTKVVTIEMEQSDHQPDISISPFINGSEKWKSTRPLYLEDLRDLSIDDAVDTWSIKTGETEINDFHFSTDEYYCKDEGEFMYGHVNEWSIESTMHPVHTHMFPMQVVSEGCGIHEVGQFYDTILYQADWREKHPKPCKVRLRFVDVGGRTAIHCHMPQHEDQGSMVFINVSGGDFDVAPNEPRVLTCSSPPCDEPAHVSKTCGPTSINEFQLGDSYNAYDPSISSDPMYIDDS